jgi:hypothetical protein
LEWGVGSREWGRVLKIAWNWAFALRSKSVKVGVSPMPAIAT